MHKRTFTRAAGVSPPWVECCRSKRGSFRTAGLRQPLLGVKTAATREMRIPLRIRHVHHGWLTPAALGREDGSRARDAYSICGFDTFTPTGLRQPLLVRGVASLEKTPFALHTSFRRKTPFAVHKRTFLRSGDRQPTVVAELRDYITKMRLFAATEHHQERRALARCGDVTHLQRRQCDTAGSREPLLGVMTAAAREMRIPSVNSTRSPRLAYASRSWCAVSVR